MREAAELATTTSTEPSLVADPWLGLAAARRLRAEGRFGEASAAYANVARDRRTEAAAEAARRERAVLHAWLEPGPVGPAGPVAPVAPVAPLAPVAGSPAGSRPC